MTDHRTEPPITEQQNTEPFLRLLTAQRRLYADVKATHNGRLIALGAIAAITLIVAALAPSVRNYVGGSLGLIMGVWAVVADMIEKKKNGIAASIQEEFDTRLYGIDQHPFFGSRHSDLDVTEAEARGSRDDLTDWYQPESISDLVRPLDAIVCQRANLDYGVLLHRAYARILLIGLISAGLLATVFGLALGYSVSNFLFGLIAPLLPPVLALVREATAHRESAAKKESAQTKVADMWRRALDDPAAVDDAQVRQAQDQILEFRKTNARIPDRFYDRKRDKNEAKMLAHCSRMVEEARARGRVLPGRKTGNK